MALRKAAREQREQVEGDSEAVTFGEAQRTHRLKRSSAHYNTGLLAA
jgi:hypothetical protein